MIKPLKVKAHSYWTQWIKKRIQPVNPQIIHSQNLYILPSKFGWVYALMLITLLTGAINYQISAIYLMTFLLGVVGLVSAWETHSNIKELSIQFISIDDVQQGQPAQLVLLVQSGPKIRFALEFQIEKQAKINLGKIPHHQALRVTLPVETTQRGFFSAPKITISSRFPLGIFCAWSYVFFDEHYYVYPQPLEPGFWPLPIAKEQLIHQHSLGQDELYDLKQVQHPWSEPNRIAWKIAAKGQGWYIKTMISPKGDYWLFRLSDLTTGLETKLQYISYWLYAAEANGYTYSIELDKRSYDFSRGNEHLKYLLRQLALYQ